VSEIPADYEERLYAGWLGKAIGVRLGAPVEGWSQAEIARHLGPIQSFVPLPPGRLFAADDDTSIPLILVRALDRHGFAVTPAQLGDELLNGVADGRGTIWWGGYGVSTEHTAYANLASGIAAPRSGSATLNGVTLSEQIGGQIFSDVWGLVAPGRPALAADLAVRAASVTHDGEGLNGARFVAACVSAAFAERRPAALVEAGLVQLPPGSEYARVVNAVLAWHRRTPDDWRACYSLIAEQFGYERYGGIVPIISNAAIVVLALLYGDGDFAKAVRIATAAGWDTDCNAGNVGAIMGVAVGLAELLRAWPEHPGDLLVTAGLVGAANLADIPAVAEWLGAVGAQLVGLPAPKRRPRCHFGYPGATHGMRGEARGGNLIALRQVAFGAPESGGALAITIRDLDPAGELRCYRPTYLHPAELSSNGYSASFSPTIYPGQTVTATLELPVDAPAGLRAALYVQDGLDGTVHQKPGAPLEPGEQRELRLRIPHLGDALLAQVGIACRALGRPWSGRLLLRALDWGGPPSFSTSFAREPVAHGAIAGWTFLRGAWRLERGAYHGSGAGISESYTGDPAWTDLTLTVDLVPLLGDGHHLLVRVQGAQRSYVAGLAASGRAALYRNDGGYRLVAEAPCPWEHGRRYRLVLAARGPELRLAVDGAELLRWRDDRPHLSGMIGLGTLGGAHTRFERVEVRGTPRGDALQ
jgi:ADP-ribosylglycohydrolase